MFKQVGKWWDNVVDNVAPTYTSAQGVVPPDLPPSEPVESKAVKRKRLAALRKATREEEEIARALELTQKLAIEKDIEERKCRARDAELVLARKQNRWAKGESCLYTPKIQVEAGGGGAESGSQETVFEATIVGVHLEDGVDNVFYTIQFTRGEEEIEKQTVKERLERPSVYEPMYVEDFVNVKVVEAKVVTKEDSLLANEKGEEKFEEEKREEGREGILVDKDEELLVSKEKKENNNE